jgi:hyaluronoglucosaminidase
MPAFEASLIPLRTIADYLRDPDAYDPDEAWRAAVDEAVPDVEDRAAFMRFGRCVQDSCLHDDAMPDVGPLLAEAAFAWRTGRLLDAVAILDAVAHQIAGAARRLQRDGFSNPALQSDIAPWVAKFANGGEAFASMAASIAAADALPRIEGQPYCGPEHLEALRGALEILQSDRQRVFGDGLEMTLAELIEEFEWVSRR